MSEPFCVFFVFGHQTALMTMFCQPGQACSANITGGRRRWQCTVYSRAVSNPTILLSCTQKCTAASVGEWVRFCTCCQLAATPPTAHSLNRKIPCSSTVAQPLLPEMMTHSFGPHVCTFPMVLPVCASLK